jgi:hypothetical protein
MAQNLVTITEVSDAGSVPALRAKNQGSRPGEDLRFGYRHTPAASLAYQGRVVNLVGFSQ